MDPEENNNGSQPPKNDDSKNWKLGIFYFNPKDKRLFPPKRLGLGWTINFANPYSVASMLVVVTLLIVVVNVLKKMA